MILLAVGLARAIDAHGPAALAGQGGAQLWTWSPEVAAPWEPSVGIVTELATATLVERTTDASSTAVDPILGPFAGGTLGARVGVARWGGPRAELGVGLHASMPAFWELDDTVSGPSTGAGLLADAGGGAALGDARTDLPVTVRVGERVRVAAALVPGLSLPTGTIDRSLSGERASVRARGTVALDAGRWGLTLDAARRSAGEGVVATAENGTGARLGAALRARFGPARLALEGATWDAGVARASEVLLGVAVDGGPENRRWSVAVAGGSALGDVPGTAAARGYLRVNGTFGRAPAPPPPVVAPPPAVVEDTRPAGRHDAVLQVRDPSGAPLDATVELTPPVGYRFEDLGDPLVAARARKRAVGPDGDDVLRLAPGRWTATVTMEGRTRVAFALDVAQDSPGPAGLVAVLHPVRGAASLGVRVRDAQGNPVEGAELRLDDSVHARTSTGGAVDIAGLEARPVAVEASGDNLRGEGPLRVDLASGRAEVELVLSAPAGSVRVRARDADGLAVDAQVLAMGPEVRGPFVLGADGSELVPLAAGTWTVAASSPLHGLQEREVTLQDDDHRVPVVEFAFPPLPVGDGELCVRAVGPDGEPVAGLELRLDAAPVGRTTTGGSACIAGLVVGPHEVSLQSARIRPVEPRTVVTGAGTREVIVPVRWVPGEIDVQARTTTGLPLDAEIRFVGPAALPPARLGPDGWASYSLPPGEWTVVLASPAFGTQERAVFVEPGATHLLEVEARMAQEEGAGALLVEVLDPAGRAVGDADVQIDGVARGRTSNGGALRVGGLALGSHRVRVSAARIADVEQDVDVAGPDGRVRLETRWKPGTVTLRATTASGPSTDAMVMLSGVELRGPLAMDPRGELMLHLAPGAWSVFASSPRDGEGERAFAAPSTAPPPVIDISVRPLPPPAAEVPADVLVAVRDTDDAAVVGARVRVGEAVATTGTDGAAILEGLPPGAAPLGVAADGYAPPPDEPLSLHAGPQQRTVRLRAEPREVEVRVNDRGAPPKPLDANVAVEGRVPVAPRRTGDDGVERVALLPGVWSMAVRADGVGADVRSVRVPAGTGTLPVDFRLGAAQVTVQGEAISLGAPIRFATGTARIAPVSDALLREVAAQLLLHPEFLRVALRGHTDNVGDPASNLLLSRQRATAVRDRLVALGVPGERLLAEGFGDTVPVADNASEPGRQLNRRVEFVVVERR